MQIKVYVSNREGRKVILSSRDQQKVVEISLFPEKIVLTLQGIDFNNPVGKELSLEPTLHRLPCCNPYNYLSGVNTVTCCFAEMSVAVFQALEKTARILF